MLIPNQTIIMTWTNSNKKHYINKGYTYTKNGDNFIVNVEDMPRGSHKKIQIQCDYCKQIFTKTYKEWNHGLLSGKDCCYKCQSKKNKDVCQSKYGVDSVFKLEEVKNKTKATLQAKYGVEYITQSSEIYEKIKQTNLRKYGVPYTTQSPEIIEKMRMGFVHNNNQICKSKAEEQMCDILMEIYGKHCVFPSYPYSNIIMDCLLYINGQFVDVEYDGYYWHKNKQEYDKRRNYFVLKNNIKVLRFVANNTIPTKEQIIENVDYLIKDNHHLKIVKLDI